MHELGLVSEVLEIVVRRAEELGVRRVDEVHLLVGEDVGMSDDAFFFHWDEAVAGTVAEGARVSLERTPTGGLRLGSIMVERYDSSTGDEENDNERRRRSGGLEVPHG